MLMKQSLNNPLYPHINEGHNTRGERTQTYVEAIEMQTFGITRKCKNQLILPDEPHSRCSTAMLYTVSPKFPILIPVLFPPFIGTDIKLQNKISNRESTENINILINIIQ